MEDRKEMEASDLGFMHHPHTYEEFEERLRHLLEHTEADEK